MKASVIRKEIKYTECKTFGHAWSQFTPLDMQWNTMTGEHRLSLRCDRCTTARHDFFNRTTGELTGRKYDYSDGYSQHGVKLSKNELRIALTKLGKKLTKVA